MFSRIKIEKPPPEDYFILSTLENETVTDSSHNKCSENQVIKEEPPNDSDDSSEYEVLFLDEYSKSDQTSENHTNTSHSTETNKLRTRSTPEQIQRLIEFKRSHPGTAENLNRSDNAWNILTAELNAMGPPTRTNPQWRRAWSVYKYNLKRSGQAQADNKSNGRKQIRLRNSTDRADVPSSRLISIDDADTTNSTKDEDISKNASDQFHSLILEKMNSVIEQQTKHTNQLERLNTNLEKLIDIFTEKFI